MRRGTKRPRPVPKRGIALVAVLALLAMATAGAAWVGFGGGPAFHGTDGRLPLISQAKIAYAERDLGRADELVREILKSNPASREARLFLGRILVDRGKLSEARTLYADFLKKNPDSYRATLGMGRVCVGLGQLNLGILHLQRAAEMGKGEPDLWEVYKELALAQKAKGDTLGAMSSLQQSLALAPGQEDLSTLMTELATGGNSLARPTPGSGIPGIPKFDPLNPKPIDPSSLVPGPRVPDPASHLPKAPWRKR